MPCRSTWCDDPEGPPLAAALVHGPGGRGKTRLILEAAISLYQQRDESRRWPSAGLIELEVSSLVPEQLERLFRSSPRVFVGIDRAEQNPDAVEQVLRATWACRQGRRIRVVLSARSAGEWWADLRTRGPDVRRVLGSPATREFALSVLTPRPSDRAALYCSARSAFAVALGQDLARWSDAPVPSLDASYLDDSLSLNMAALADALGRSSESEAELFDSVLDIERAYWRQRQGERDEEQAVLSVLERVLAVLVLAQGADSRSSVRDKVEAVLALESRADAIADRVTDRLFRLYGQLDGSLAPLRPDRLGEFLVLRALEHEPRLLALVLDRSTSIGDEIPTQHSALTVLTRLATWRAEQGRVLLRQALDGRFGKLINPLLLVARETGDPIGQVATGVLDALKNKQAIARQLADRLPNESVALRELAELVTRLTIGEEPAEAAPVVEHHAYAIRRLHLWRDNLDETRASIKMRRRCRGRSDHPLHRPALASSS